MSIQQLSPYLMLNGTAERAIRHYERALGAKARHVLRPGEVPGMNPAPENKDRVMHAALRVGAGMIMLSDGSPDERIPTETNTHVCLDFDDLADMTRKFEALAAGGTVTVALHDTFWGARFGMLTDAFGIRWMFNSQTQKA